MPTALLTLDATSLPAEDLSLPALTRERSLQHRPNWLLRKLMNALEHQRAVKGLGWSRAWNKYELNIFRTHLQDPLHDQEYFAPLTPLLERILPAAPLEYQAFASDLLADPTLIVFTFFHNHATAEAQHEGLTLSFGRAIPGDPGKQDRLDVILEDRRIDGQVDGQVDRFRIYVCPWSEYQNNHTHFALELQDFTMDTFAPAQALYENCVRHYHLWKGEESRQWSHWSARYIDYFGPRSFIPAGSSFS